MPEQPSTDLAVRVPELERYRQLGRWLSLSETGLDTEAVNGASAALRLYFAEALGLPPMAAAELSVIRGKLFVQSKLLRGLAARAGYRVRRVDSSDESCTAVLEKDGEEIGRSTFTIADAKRAGLIREKSAWLTYPDRMLWAKASKYVLDDNAPEVTLGLMLEEELEEIEPTDIRVLDDDIQDAEYTVPNEPRDAQPDPSAQEDAQADPSEEDKTRPYDERQRREREDLLAALDAAVPDVDWRQWAAARAGDFSELTYAEAGALNRTLRLELERVAA